MGAHGKGRGPEERIDDLPRDEEGRPEACVVRGDQGDGLPEAPEARPERWGDPGHEAELAQKRAAAPALDPAGAGEAGDVPQDF
eukprot:8929298-Alexandrium_andersonii.AAC.1